MNLVHANSADGIHLERRLGFMAFWGEPSILVGNAAHLWLAFFGVCSVFYSFYRVMRIS